MYKILFVLTLVLFAVTPVLSSEPGRQERPPVVTIEAPPPVVSEIIEEPAVISSKNIEPIPTAKTTEKPLVPLVENENNNFIVLPPMPQPTPRIVKEEWIIQWPQPQPTEEPTPPPTPEPIIEPQQVDSATCCPPMYPGVPYEVKVQYTPIKPQPFEYSYVTCLPYNNYGYPYYNTYNYSYVPPPSYGGRVRSFVGQVLCTPINGVQYVTNGAFNIVKKTFGLLTVDCPTCPPN